MKICVIGGGNVGTLISAELSLSGAHDVSLLASRAYMFSNEITIEDWNDNSIKTAHINLITDDKEKALNKAEVILITVPANIVPITVKEIAPYVKPGTLIGVIPGSGGVEFASKILLEKGCILFGLQRVPSITRTKEYGKIVVNQSRKTKLEVAAIPIAYSKKIAELMELLFNIPCEELKNFLSVTLTPSNPILHTTRLYSIFKNYREGTFFENQIYFYKDWNDEASEMLINCDLELQNICKSLIELDMSGVKSLLKHYEVNNKEEMTNKISNIKAFENIFSPLIKTDKGYIPDFDNRYFTADFPYGLCIIKGIGELVKIATPNIDKVLKWYEKFADKEYFIGNDFIGKDIKETGIPQNYGIDTREALINFYR